MRLLTFFLFAALISVHAEGLAQKVSISGKDLTFKKVFSRIEQQTGYVFLSNKGTLNLQKTISLSVHEMALQEFLDLVLKDENVEYVIEGKTIFLSKKKVAIEIKSSSPSFPSTALPEYEEITGRITDSSTHQPIAGANIVVKGAGKGVSSDLDGRFKIHAHSGNILVISFVGYATKEVAVGASKTVVIQLSVIKSSMTDVVVIGMYTRKASTFTGSTTTFTQEDLVRVNNQNLVQSLKNLDPSFRVLDNTQFGSDPNRLPDITLRGQSGFPDLNGEYGTNPNLPLFILDGFETTLQKIVDLDPYRIKTLTLLKDAAAKGIYGARAANGVVVIETIRPAVGKLQMTYNGNLNVEAPDLSSYNLTNASQKLEVEDAANIYYSPYPTEQYTLMRKRSEVAELVDRGVNTDWLAQPVRAGIGQRHSLRLEGGDPYLRYGVDLMLNEVKGAMKGSDRRTGSGSVELLYRVKNLSFNNLLTVGFNKANNSPYGDFQRYTLMNPYLPKTDTNGSIQPLVTTNVVRTPFVTGATTVLTPLQFSPTFNDPVVNPLYNATIGVKDFSRYTDITNNFNMEWALKRELVVRGRLGVSKQTSSADQFLPASHTNFYTWTSDALKPRRGRYTKTYGESSFINGNLSLNYTGNFGKHQVFANAGYDISERKSNSQTYIVEGFPDERTVDLTAGYQYSPDTRRPTGINNIVRDMGLFGAANYSWNDRFLLDLSYRVSQSSQFGADRRWGSFWSAGIGWNLHKETWVKSLGFVQQFRVRASTGYTGSQNFNSYMSYATYSYIMGDTYANGNGASLMSLANPDLQWQQKQDNNIGVDLSLFKRLDLRVDYYLSNTTGLITDITLPPSAGFSTYKANLGTVRNEGVELRLNYRVFSGSDRRNSLSVFATVAHNKNTLKEISNALTTWNDKRDAETAAGGGVIYRDSAATSKLANRPKVRYVLNQSMNAIWAVRSLGIDPATGAEIYLTKNGKLTSQWDPADQIVAGDNLPKFSGNFGFNFLLNGWTLTSSFMYQLGGQVYNQTLVDKVENANIYQNVDQRVLTGRWRKPGDVAFFKNIADFGLTRPSTRFVMDQNTLDLASLNLSYDLDRFAIVKKHGFRRLRVGGTVNDVFTISSVQVERGTSYPFARRFSFTLQAMF